MTNSKPLQTILLKVMNCAIAETSGQQFWFEVNRYYDIDRFNAKEKDKITLEKILLLKDKNSITIGKPYVENAKIELEVVSHKRAKKFLFTRCVQKKRQEERWVTDKNLQGLW